MKSRDGQKANPAAAKPVLGSTATRTANRQDSNLSYFQVQLCNRFSNEYNIRGEATLGFANGCRKRFMKSYRVLVVVWLTVLGLLAPVARLRADTWQLEPGQDWKLVPSDAQDKYLRVVARTEKLIQTGQAKALAEQWQELKKDFPEIAEADLNTFIEAEILFCKDNYAKASRTYDKFLDKDYIDSPLYQAALERQFHIASSFFAGRKLKVLGIIQLQGHATAIKIMDKITERAGDRQIGIEAARIVAEHYERKGKFNEAYLKWSEISWQRPTGRAAKDALLGMARCKHAVYRGPKYNASHLSSARSYYQEFQARYPQDAKELRIDEILPKIDEQIAYKKLTIGQYYQRTGKAQAANLYYDMVIRNWGDTKAAEIAQEMLSKSLPDRPRDK